MAEQILVTTTENKNIFLIILNQKHEDNYFCIIKKKVSTATYTRIRW